MARERSSVGKVLESIKGFSMQELRPEYRGEDSKVGWRADVAPRPQGDRESDADYADYLSRKADPARTERVRESDTILTKYYDPAERDAAKVTFDEQGRAVGSKVERADRTKSRDPRDQGVLDKTEIEYVSDAQGVVHQFSPGFKTTGNTKTSELSGKQVDQREFTHHSSVLAGEAVSAAGEMKLYQGYLVEISNKSGHYKPAAKQILQLLEELARNGALLDKDWAMPDENGAAQNLEGKALQIYTAMVAVEGGLSAKLAAGKDVSADLAAIAKGKQALGKLGAGPKNKFRPVTVSVVEGADKKTGAEIHQAEAVKSKAEHFLRTGGDSKAAAEMGKAGGQAPNAPVLAEIKASTAGKKRDLDAVADVESAGLAGRIEETRRKLAPLIASYEDELRRLQAVKGEAAEGRRATLRDALVRMKGAMDRKPTDVSEAALAEVLGALQARVKPREIALSPSFGSEVLKLRDYPVSWFVERLGITTQQFASSVEWEGEESDEGAITVRDLLGSFGKRLGISTPEEMHRKLFGD